MKFLAFLLLLVVREIRCQYWNDNPAIRLSAVDWSYDPETGRLPPNKWYLKYPKCNGNSQSPIEVKKSDLKSDPSLSEAHFIHGENLMTNIEIENDGTKLVFTVDEENDVRLVSKNLSTGYLLKRFYFKRPSEHVIGDKVYMGELQLEFEPMLKKTTAGKRAIHVSILLQDAYKQTKKRTIDDGLAVLAHEVEHVRAHGEKTKLTGKFRLKQILPSEILGYIRYAGSESTPPCSESVDRYIMTSTALASAHAFEPLWNGVTHYVPVGRNEKGPYKLEAVRRNNRPTQDVNGRVLRLYGSLGSFKKHL